MTGRTKSGQFAIQVSDDRMSATLSVPPNLKPSEVTGQAVLAELEAAGLAKRSAWTGAIRDAVARYQAEPREMVEVTLEGDPPTEGEHGWFEWDRKCDPARQPKAGANDDPADFYSHSPFIMVMKEQRIGRLHPPVEGEAGMTVTGEPAMPRPVREAELRVDTASVQLADDGECTAVMTGVLHHEDGTLRVDPCLQVEEYVDFSTGHIRFEGDVIVREGVRDLFEVRTTGSVQVMGLVEAARIVAGQNFNADGGMAGREKGSVEVGRDMTARYLSGVTGTVRRHLEVEREIVNCQLSVGGELRAERGVLMGGEMAVTGRVVLRDLGSQAGHETRLAIGSAPAIEAGIAQAAAMIFKIDKQLSDEEAEVFNVMTHRGGPAAEELLNNLKVTKANLKQQRDALESKQTALKALLEKRRHTELIVHRAIHPGVVLLYRNQSFTFKETIEGPLVIGHKRDQPNDLILKELTSGEQRMLLEVAKMRVLAGGKTPTA
ncbi:DUF342 domain-containing protein [Phycisphaerales bacterium AB-hyl4]|uniref:DUF342 domain-containing protein n=1 Tax=Natronomicrosphaera hydrolytica TaxID=3242702 RepID=A0ABV4UAJ2_9BACT